MTAAVKIGCPWCMDFGYWMLHGHGIPREKIEAVPYWRDSEVFSRWSAWSWSTPRP
jgi:hypothetical protein